MNQVINNSLIGLNEVGGVFFNYAANVFIQTALLVILLFIIDLLLRKRVRAIFRYCVWLLVLVKLILPPMLSLPTGIGYWAGDHLPIALPVSNMAFDADAIEHTGPSGEMLHARPAENLAGDDPANYRRGGSRTAPTLTPLTWKAVVFLLWLAGVLAFLAVLVQRIRFVKGLVAASSPAGDELIGLLEQCRLQMTVRRKIKLRLSEAVPSPAVCGLLRPTVLMPTSLVEKLSPEGLRATLIHELAHIKRGDLWVNSVQTFLQVVYFYNPFVWFANSIIRKVCEEAVDETVLVALGGQAKDYSNTLIDIGEMVFWKADLGLRLIGVAESKKALQWRIRHMLNRPIPKSSKLGALGIIMLLVIAAVLLPMARAEKAAKATKRVIAENEKEPARSLHQAAMYGDVEQVKALIADGAHVNAKDKLGSTPLHRAAEKGSAVIVELLIARGADVNAKCRLGFTPLHRAASKGHKDVVQLLLESDAKINVKSSLGHTPLHSAIFRDHTDVARMLIRHGADVNMRAGSDDIATPMDLAVRKGLHDMVELLIENGADIPFPDIHFAAFQGDVSKVKDLIRRGVSVDEEDRRGKTPLFFAVCGGQRETVDFLLSNAADIDAGDVDGTTPLHHTASSGNLKMTELLLDKGADIDVRDKWGGTPLHGAAEEGWKETVSLLIKKGADVNAKNKESRTPLHEAVEWGGREVVALLIAAGADVGAEDENGYTPLHLATVESEPDEDIIDLLKSKGATLTATIHLAAETGDFAGLKRYIEEGTDINKKDKSGSTPLLLAVFCGQEGGQEEVVEFLLANGADVNAGRNDGWTPLHMACLIGRKDMVELIIAKGADVNAKSDDGRTAADFAKRLNYSEIIDLLGKHGAKGNPSTYSIDAPSTKSLHEAAEIGDVEEIKRFIAERIDLNVMDEEKNMTPLCSAAFKGHTDVVKVLLGNGANVELGDSQYTPLFYAIWGDIYTVKANSEETVKALIAAGANVNMLPGPNDFTPLVYAIWDCPASTVKILLDAGADINMKDVGGYTPLYWAAFTGNRDMLEMILTRSEHDVSAIHLAAYRGDLIKVRALVKDNSDIDVRDQFNCTPLHWAALADTTHVANFFLSKGADANARDNLEGTPLVAARGLDMVKLFISKGVDVNAKLKLHKMTRLHKACSEGDEDVAEVLIAHGADVDAFALRNMSPLHLAAGAGHKSIVELLINKGANVNAKNRLGPTVLEYAKRKGHTDIIELLKKRGAKESAQATQPQGPVKEPHIEMAINSNDLEKVKELIAQGANVNARDRFGNTPLLQAIIVGKLSFVETLISAGADVNIKNMRGHTPLYLAKQRDNTEIVKLLRKHGAKE